MGEFSASCACSVKCGCGISRLFSCLFPVKRKNISVQTDENITGKLFENNGTGDRVLGKLDAKRIAPPPPPPSRVMPLFQAQQQEAKNRINAFAPTKEELLSSKSRLKPVRKSANSIASGNNDSNSDSKTNSCKTQETDKGKPSLPVRSASEPASNSSGKTVENGAVKTDTKSSLKTSSDTIQE